jgi:hypothetical protein
MAAAMASPAFRGVPQLPGQDLALDLEADDEEEQGHEPVVDPQQERLRNLERPRADGEVRPPQVGVERGERAVGPDECHDSGPHEEDAAGGIRVEELLEGTEEPAGAGGGRRGRFCHRSEYGKAGRSVRTG